MSLHSFHSLSVVSRLRRHLCDSVRVTGMTRGVGVRRGGDVTTEPVSSLSMYDVTSERQRRSSEDVGLRLSYSSDSDVEILDMGEYIQRSRHDIPSVPVGCFGDDVFKHKAFVFTLLH